MWPRLAPVSLKVTPEDTREDRAVELYAGLGRFIRKIGAENLFEVPSQYGGFEESCSCHDHTYRGVTCVHLLAVGLAHAARRRRGRRRHTFECAGCRERFPLKDAIVVHEEQSAFSGFFEGELTCTACARSEGVL